MLPVEYLPLGVTLIAPKHGGRTHGAIFALCALLIAGPTLARALTGAGTLDSDVWFLLATGREIARNGIPRTNPFSIWPGQGIVVQQWLHDVWLWAWYTRGGYTAVAVSACVPAGLLFWQLSRLMLDAAGGKLSRAGLAFSLAIPSVCICMYISVRPTLWTALLCTLTARIMLSYLRDGRRLVLLWLPAVAVAGVNLQAAHWPLLAGIAAGVLHSRCMWIAGLFCGLCCAFGLAGALGEPVAHPGRAAAAAGAAMALIAAVSGLAVSLAPQSGGEAGMLSVTESEMSPIFSAIYDAGSDALVFSSDVSVYNQLEWEGFKVPCDMRPEIWGEGIAGAGAESAYREIVDVLQGSTSLEESTEDWGWELFLVRDDEADALRSGGHFDELAHGGGYTLFELPEGGE